MWDPQWTAAVLRMGKRILQFLRHKIKLTSPVSFAWWQVTEKLCLGSQDSWVSALRRFLVEVYSFPYSACWVTAHISGYGGTESPTFGFFVLFFCFWWIDKVFWYKSDRLNEEVKWIPWEVLTYDFVTFFSGIWSHSCCFLLFSQL